MPDLQALYYARPRAPAPLAAIRGARAFLQGRPRLQSTGPNPTAMQRVCVDVARFRGQRLAALREHRTQLPAKPWQRALAPWLAPRNHFAFSTVECFDRAADGAQCNTVAG